MQLSVLGSGLVRFAKALAGCWFNKGRAGVLRCAALPGVVKASSVLRPGLRFAKALAAGSRLGQVCFGVR
jgi:hypothetical protein